LTLNHRRAIVITNTHAKAQGQRSVGSKELKQTDGHTDGRGGDYITVLTRSGIIKTNCMMLWYSVRKG